MMTVTQDLCLNRCFPACCPHFNAKGYEIWMYWTSEILAGLIAGYSFRRLYAALDQSEALIVQKQKLDERVSREAANSIAIQDSIRNENDYTN